MDHAEKVLREALESSGQRFTDQRAAVFRFLQMTTSHPTADEVFSTVRKDVPAISLATVYKSLETLVGCGLATKLTYGDGSARYDGRTDPHHHLTCLDCRRVFDLPERISHREIKRLESEAPGFRLTQVRVEFSGYCPECEERRTEPSLVQA